MVVNINELVCDSALQPAEEELARQVVDDRAAIIRQLLDYALFC